MEIEVKVNIDWIEEDETFDSTVKHEIVTAISSEILKRTKQSQDEIIAKLTSNAGLKLEEVLDKKLDNLYENFLEKKISTYDKWGDKIGDTKSVKDILKSKFDSFMDEKFDKDGRSSRYGSTPRFKHILEQHSQDQIEQFMKKMSAEITRGIKKEINDEAVARVSKAILSDCTLKELIK